MPIIVTPTFGSSNSNSGPEIEPGVVPGNFGYVSATASELNARATGIVVTLPTYQPGDMFLAFAMSYTYSVTASAGWRKRVDPAAGEQAVHCFTKVAVANEPNPTFTYSGADIHVVAIATVRSAYYAGGLYASDTAFPACPSANNGLVFAMIADFHNGTTTRDFTGSGWSELIDHTSSVNDGANNYNHFGLYGATTSGTTTPRSPAILDSNQALAYQIGMMSVGPVT